MTKQTIRVCTVMAFAALFAVRQPAFAQAGQSGGWPEKAGAAQAAALPPRPAAAAPPAKASVTKVSPPKARVEHAPAAAKAPAAAAAPTVAPAPVAKAVAVDAVAGEVVQALQQQSDILKRLAGEIEAQRAVMREQQEKIKALELKAAPSATATPAPAAPAAKVAAPPPITVETGGMKLKVAGLFQGWYTWADAAVVDTFRLRRSELKFTVDMNPRVKWTLMIDPAKALSLTSTTATMGGQTVVTSATVGQSGRILQDAFVAITWKPSLSVEVGQQKVPLTYEGSAQSSGKLETAERALFMTDKFRSSGYGDVRDLGVTVRGKMAQGQFEYAAGVFNGLGEGFNDVDKNEQKTWVSRLAYRPAAIKGLQIGGSIARDGLHVSDPSTRERQGADLLYARGPYGVKAEYMAGRDGAITREGSYVQLTRRMSKPLQLVFRVDSWDPDTRSNNTAATVNERDWLGGYTYSLGNTGAWVQMNYIHKTFDGVIKARDVFMTNVQTTW